MVAPNWLGDAVMALPAISDIRRRFPVRPARRRRAPRGGRPLSPRPVRGRAVDAAVERPLWHRHALGGRCGAPAGVGRRHGDPAAEFLRGRVARSSAPPSRADGDTPRTCAAPLLSRAVPRPRGSLHQGAYYQHLTRALGFESGPLEPVLTVPDAVAAAARAQLRRARLGCGAAAVRVRARRRLRHGEALAAAVRRPRGHGARARARRDLRDGGRPRRRRPRRPRS